MSEELKKLEIKKLRKRFLENLVESYTISGADVMSDDSQSYARAFDELRISLKDSSLKNNQKSSEYMHV